MWRSKMIKVRPSAEIYRSASTAHSLSLASACPWEVFHIADVYADVHHEIIRVWCPHSMSITVHLSISVHHLWGPLCSVCPFWTITCIGAKACPGMRTEPAASPASRRPPELSTYYFVYVSICIIIYHNISYAIWFQYMLPRTHTITHTHFCTHGLSLTTSTHNITLYTCV